MRIKSITNDGQRLQRRPLKKCRRPAFVIVLPESYTVVLSIITFAYRFILRIQTSYGFFVCMLIVQGRKVVGSALIPVEEYIQ